MRPLEATTRRLMHVPACVAAVIALPRDLVTEEGE